MPRSVKLRGALGRKALAIPGSLWYSLCCCFLQKSANAIPERYEEGWSMSWKSLTGPLAVIIIGVVVIVLVLTAPEQPSGTGAYTRSIAAQDDEPCSSYPKPGDATIPPRCQSQSTDDPYPAQETPTATSGTATVTTTTTPGATALTPAATLDQTTTPPLPRAQSPTARPTAETPLLEETPPPGATPT